MRDFITVAIDGAAASGKTSTALRIADKYKFLVASTGSYYRAIALKMMKTNINSDDISGIQHFLGKILLETKIIGNVSNITVDGKSFEEKELRTQQVNKNVASYATIPAVRQRLLSYQRSQINEARTNGFRGLVMEGRDITSVILPDADLRFFLEASAQERLSRRENDWEYDYTAERDKIDIGRTIQQNGVHKIDTGTNGLDVVVAMISAEVDKILSTQGQDS
ncbi:MAG: (d)CMP kinase [Puniceicoccales bacterium]|jgi:cytidylate kinase|nr:(d)CMP kinase [Puniceicoccales bacterium]